MRFSSISTTWNTVRVSTKEHREILERFKEKKKKKKQINIMIAVSVIMYDSITLVFLTVRFIRETLSVLKNIYV